MRSPLETALLPQYESSTNFFERFLDAISTDASSVSRCASIPGKVKVADEGELITDALNYFVEHKAKIEDEFFQELLLSLDEDKANQFIEIISKNWYDGRSKRQAEPVMSLKMSIKRYIESLNQDNNDSSNIVVCCEENNSLSFLDEDDLAHIFQVNHSMLYQHIEAWIDSHPRSRELSRGSVYFRRGISVEEIFKDKAAYIEWDYINSYSMAFSVSEQFASLAVSGHKVLISSDCDFFNERVLFFSPFIRGMPAYQLEVGIIPTRKKQILHYQGLHSGIHEFFLDYERT